MKMLILICITVMSFSIVARTDADTDLEQQRRDDKRAYEKRQQQQRDDARVFENRQQRQRDDKKAYEKRHQQQRDEQRAYENRPQPGAATKETKECEDGKRSEPSTSDRVRSAPANQPSTHPDKHPDYDCMNAEDKKATDISSTFEY